MTVPVALDLPGYGVSVEQLVSVARRAEAAGLRGVWVAEYFRNAHVVAAVLARETSTIEVGTALSWAFPRSPLVTALAALDLAEISNGRFRLGLGAQVKAATERWHGLDHSHPVARLTDYVAGVRAAMGAGGEAPARHQGPFYEVDLTGYRRVAPPAPDVPILMGAVGPAMLRAAVQAADGVLGHVLWSDSHYERVVAPIIEAAGRPTRVVTTMLCAVSDDAATARREARRTLGFYAATKTYRAMLGEDGFGDEADAARRALAGRDHAALEAAVTDRMLAAYALAGSPAEVRQQLAARTQPTGDLLIVPAYFGVEGRRLAEQLDALVETFASATTG